jgi:hypothetical protein
VHTERHIPRTCHSSMKVILDPWFTYNESRIHGTPRIPGNRAVHSCRLAARSRSLPCTSSRAVHECRLAARSRSLLVPYVISLVIYSRDYWITRSVRAPTIHSLRFTTALGRYARHCVGHFYRLLSTVHGTGRRG